VDLLEPTQNALRREMREELGVEVHIERLLWVAEEFFVIGQVPHHQVGFYYFVTFAQRQDLYDVRRIIHASEEDMPILLQWFPLGSFDRLPNT
jgi:ADP-ribose pyrophosphatase YjhB (NUDIX family)